MRARGVGHGTHVAVMLPSVPAYAITWFALARLGAVMIPVNMQYKPGDLEYVLRDSEARYLVIDESVMASFEAIGKGVIPQGNVIVHALADAPGLPRRAAATPRNDSWHDMVAAARDTPIEVPNVNAETLMSVQYTCGSTG